LESGVAAITKRRGGGGRIRNARPRIPAGWQEEPAAPAVAPRRYPARADPCYVLAGRSENQRLGKRGSPAMSLFTEFRSFAVRGNAIDLAVGVIIGAAFGKIIESMVGDLVTPFLSALLGGQLDFTNLYIVLGSIPEGMANNYDTLKKAGVPLFAYGSFITILINFMLMAFAIFMLVRLIGKWKDQLNPPAAPAAPPGPTPTETLLAEIRDLMKEPGGATAAAAAVAMQPTPQA
jgi:large conductance mechanosensitive channel